MPVSTKAFRENDSARKLERFIDQDDEYGLFCLGPGGSGKSELLKHIASYSNANPVILAPTGIAAEKIGGQTIHSFCQLKKGNNGKISKFCLKDFDKSRVKVSHVELILIDEISMVRINLIRYLDKFIRHLNGCPDKPFGGAKIIMFGDEYQLAPIKGKPAYCWKLFKKYPVKKIRLKAIYRQEDQKTQNALNIIRKGKSTHLKSVLKYINRCCYSPDYEPGSDTITICSTNKIVRSYNQKSLQMLSSKGEITYQCSDGKELILRPGARVIATRNNPRAGYFNGSLGIVIRCVREGPVVRFDNGKTEVKVSNYYWSNAEEAGSAIPLRLAFAITIHKAQGQTFDKVLLDLNGALFAKGQLYVALSRVKSFSKLKITRKLRTEDVLPNDEYVRVLRRLKYFE